MAEHKLDIFDVLNAIDTHDYEFLSRQPEETRKGFAPVVAMRWASAVPDGPNSDITLLMVNEVANRDFFAISDHPELQFKLLAASGLGRKQRHQWIPMTKQKKGTTKVHEYLSKYWPDANDTELNLLVGQFTRDTFIDFLNECACEPSEATGLIEAFDRLHGIEPNVKKSTKGGKRKS